MVTARRCRLEMSGHVSFVIAVSILELIGVERRISEHFLDNHSRVIVIRVNVVDGHVKALIQRMIFGRVSVDSLTFSTSTCV
jgi:hypothetical protein